MNGRTTSAIIFWLCFLIFAELGSWATASWPGPCLVQAPEVDGCPTFLAGVGILIDRLDKFIGEHDKSIVAVFTVVLALSTIGLWLATNRLWKAGEKQIAVAARAAEAANKSAEAAEKSADAGAIALRPWISCKVEIGGPLTYTPEGHAKFVFRFILENVGHSPAFGVRLTPSLNLLSPTHEHSILKLLRMADHNRAMPVKTVGVLIPGGTSMGGGELGLILFPKDIQSVNYTIRIHREEIDRSCEDIKPNMHFFPEIRGLVTYTYPLADVRADTGFVCSIENVSPESRSGTAFELFEPVRSEYIRIVDHSLWAGFAT